jgi:hypothetical protein
MRKIISFMHISLDGFVAGPNGEMDWIKVDDEIFDYVGKRISKGDTALFGRGIPLFVDIKDKIKLKLLPTTRQFACGVTELNYAVDRQ